MREPTESGTCGSAALEGEGSAKWRTHGSNKCLGCDGADDSTAHERERLTGT